YLLWPSGPNGHWSVREVAVLHAPDLFVLDRAGRQQQGVLALADDDVGFRGHTDLEWRIPSESDADAIAPRDRVPLRRYRLDRATKNLAREGIRANQDYLTRRDARDVLLVDLGGNSQWCTTREPEDRLVRWNHLPDLTVTANDVAIGWRDQFHEIRLRRRLGHRGLGGVPIRTGSIKRIAGNDLPAGEAHVAFVLSLRKALLRLQLIQCPLQVFVLQLRQCLTCRHLAPFVDVQLHQPRRAARGDRHHDGRFHGARCINRLYGSSTDRMDPLKGGPPETTDDEPQRGRQGDETDGPQRKTSHAEQFLQARAQLATLA